MNYRVGIYDSDLSYAASLMEYLNQRTDLPLTLYAFSGPDEVEAGILKYGLCLLLVGEEVYARLDTNRIPSLILSEEASETEPAVLCRYQSAEQLAVRMLEFLKGSVKKVLRTEGLLTAVLSPYGRSGKTTLARGISTCFKRSIYIGMEELPPDGSGEEEKKCSEGVIYRIVGRDPGFTELIRREEAYDSLLSGVGFPELRELSRKDLEFMVSCIRDRGEYRRIVFDLALASLSELGTLSLMDRIYVTVPHRTNPCKLASFTELLQKNGAADAAERFVPVELTPELLFGDGLAEWIAGGGI